ncbi:MAG: S8 family serine peptidase [Saprospiraceae bacterium]|nr:S8 family serine peptidase [Saprospiraceae bacterium]
MNHFPKLLFLLPLLVSASLVAQTIPHRPGEFLVSLSVGEDAVVLMRRMPTFSDSERISDLLNIWILRNNLPEQEVLKWLREQPEVRSAQFNHLLENRTLPDDPLFPQQWYLRNDGSSGGTVDADLDAEKAWDITTGGLSPAGDTIVIAIIDGGLNAAHPDLAANLWRNRAEIPNNDIDDDGNGYTDDFRGWNVFSQTDDIEGSTTTHGTPVSAIMGARGNNGIGMTGINWNTKILFLAASGTEANVLAAYDYVYQTRKRYNSSWGDQGAFVVAVNCSWGVNYGQPADAPLWCEAFDKLGEVGIVSVAATANLPINVDVLGDLPTACLSNYLIGVTSLRRNDQKAENAAWGAQHVDLGAYGQDVLSAATSGGYGNFSGTSFAAPQVTGAIGLLYSAPCPNLIALAKTDPASAAYWAKSLILENVTPNASLSGKTFTNGRLNLYQTLQTYENQCSNCPAPFALKAEMLTESSAILLWSKPPAAIHINLRWRMLGMLDWNTLATVSAPFLLSDLADCAVYEFEVQTICEGGETSPWSLPFIFTTQGCCTPPASIWMESGTLDLTKIAWEASSLNNEYRLRLRKAGNTVWAYFEADTNFWVFQNLLPCAQYEMQVQSYCQDWITDYSSLFSFQTKGCGACNDLEYCLVKAQNATEEWISLVQIGAWFNESGSGGYGYQKFTEDQAVMPKLVAGAMTPVVVKPGFSGVASKEYFRIFIDYNQDGDFDDADELAFDPGFALEGLAEGFIQSPAFAMAGITRARVMMKYTTPNDNPPTPCTPFDFGQVEDYCVELLLDSVSTSIPVEDTVWMIRAFPQPAGDWVMLEFPAGVSKSVCEIQVVNAWGQTMTVCSTTLMKNSKLYIETSQWPAGIYGVQLRCGARVIHGKLLKG